MYILKLYAIKSTVNKSMICLKNSGLRGINVADTKISGVTHDNNLLYRGYNVQDLVKHSTYEEVAYLLLHDELPTKTQLSSFKETVAEAYKIPDPLTNSMLAMRKKSDPIEVLQALVASLEEYYEDEELSRKEAVYDRACNMIAKIPVLVSYWHRIRNGKKPVPPKPDLGHAANFLYMMTGCVPDAQMAKALEACMILHADVTFSSSTFTARVVASTRAHMYSAASAAIGSLSGRLHGGANHSVMRMLLSMGDIDNVEPWIKQRLDKGERVMGVGHAKFRKFDPRADVLKKTTAQLAKHTNQPWYDMAVRVEEVAKNEFKTRKNRHISSNVDLYCAPIYYMLGIPIDTNTSVFAAAVCAGWAAHIMEEEFSEAAPKPAMYRPDADYIGKLEGSKPLRYVVIAERGKGSCKDSAAAC